MSHKVYRDFDQATLERQYNPASNIPNAAELQSRRRAASLQARDTLRCSCDVPYGPSAGETLDIFYAASNNSPIQLFIHGGSWRAQDKQNFSFLAEPLVKAGVTALIVNYSLCPAVTIDEIVRQCREAVAWAFANARILGGDPNRISVCGQSAGAHLAVRALEADWSQFGRTPDDVVKAVAAVSGLYDLEPIRLSATNKDVRLDAEQTIRNSPMSHPLRRRVPLLLSVGDQDNDEFQRQTNDFAAALTQKNYLFKMIPAAGHNHFSILEAMADPKHPLGKGIIDLALTAGRP